MSHDRINLEPLGDARVQITYMPGQRNPDGSAEGLVTWRLGKDTDMTPEQMRAIAGALEQAAREMEGRAS